MEEVLCDRSAINEVLKYSCFVCCRDCREETYVVADNHKLPSGDNVKKKVSTWRSESNRFELEILHSTEPLNVCEECLSLISEVDSAEVQLNGLKKQLWRRLELREEEDSDEEKLGISDSEDDFLEEDAPPEGHSVTWLHHSHHAIHLVKNPDYGKVRAPVVIPEDKIKRPSRRTRQTEKPIQADDESGTNPSDEPKKAPAKRKPTANASRPNENIKTRKIAPNMEDLLCPEVVMECEPENVKEENEASLFEDFNEEDDDNNQAKNEDLSNSDASRIGKYSLRKRTKKNTNYTEGELGDDDQSGDDMYSYGAGCKSSDEEEKKEESFSFGGWVEEGRNLWVLADLALISRRVEIRGGEHWMTGECRLCDFIPDDKKPDMDVHFKKRHPTDGMPYVCHFCLTGFDTFRKYFVHVLCEELTRIRDRPLPECRICKEKYRNVPELQDHLVQDHGEKACFACSGCEGVVFQSFKDLVDHRRQQNPNHKPSRNEAEVKCPNCGLVLADAGELGSHRLSVHKIVHNAFSCPLCNEKCDSWTSFEAHLLEKEFNVARKCVLCSQELGTYWDFCHHMRNEHSASVPQTCGACFEEFDSFRRLVSHAHTHENPEVICFECGALITKWYMTTHISRQHVRPDYRNKTNLCEHCPKSLSSMQSLKLHMAQAHGINREMYMFPCDICSKVLNSGCKLRRHRFLLHGVGEDELTLYECTECGKKLTTRVDHERHMQIHLGQKPFECPHCDHRSTLFINLRSHVKSVHKRLIKKVTRKVTGPVAPESKNFVVVDNDVTEEEAWRIAGWTKDDES